MPSHLSFGKRSGRQVVSALALGILTATALAHSPADPAGVQEGHPTGHIHDRADMTWPPQPRGITNVNFRLQDDSLAVKARERLAAALERVALRRSDVQKALGNRYIRSALIEDEDKSGAAPVQRLVYFSHDRNATVEVALDGQNVRSLRTIAASEYQPEITDAEVTEAEGIARAHFGSLHKSRVEQLEAFGILAYQPVGNGFFDTRVIYISFHPDNDSSPEFAAWVDLTNRRVLRVREEQE